ncbi:hypothetical protein [Azonexus sp.]|uniref:hypothetical protein n=1 Tax=Azonexus sp. TaxID=1872668 RepID=UPI0039E685D4
MNTQTKNIPIRGSSASNPDLSWSQVRETVLMLELAVVQIETAMKDSNSSVEVLTTSFTAIAQCMHALLHKISNLPNEGAAGALRAELLGDSGDVADRVHQAIIAFQFYDKLVQRLSHVTHSLGDLSDLVGQPVRLYNPEEWVGLQNRIKAKYSTREESAMFEAVMNGVPVHEAVARFNQEMRAQEDDIEFF